MDAMNQLQIIFMFSGQGSQHYQMAAELFQKNIYFRQQMLELDDIAKAKLGESIVERIYNTNFTVAHSFDEILFTHPSIFMVEYALAKTVIALGLQPRFILGASLGELAAAATAEVLPVEQALNLVIDHAQLLHKQSKSGGLICILDDIDFFYRSDFLKNNSEVAAINSQTHFIIAVTSYNQAAVIKFLIDNHINYVTLPVHNPFHSSYIENSLTELLRISQQYQFQSPIYPLISCSTAALVSNFNSSHICSVYRNIIRVKEAAQFINDRGNFYFLDLGPSGTMANLIKLNLPTGTKSITHAILTPFRQDIKALEKALSLKSIP